MASTGKIMQLKMQMSSLVMQRRCCLPVVVRRKGALIGHDHQHWQDEDTVPARELGLLLLVPPLCTCLLAKANFAVSFLEFACRQIRKLI